MVAQRLRQKLPLTGDPLSIDGRTATASEAPCPDRAQRCYMYEAISGFIFKPVCFITNKHVFNQAFFEFIE